MRGNYQVRFCGGRGAVMLFSPTQQQQDNNLSLYRLCEQDYEPISHSEFLPGLDIDLLVRCVLMPSRLEVRTEFLRGIRR